MSTNPDVAQFNQNMRNARFKSLVNYMYMALVDFGVPGQFTPKEKTLMFGIIAQNWDRENEDTAARLKTAGVGLEGGMSTPAEYVDYIKNRCRNEYNRVMRKRWWQFWK